MHGTRKDLAAALLMASAVSACGGGSPLTDQGAPAPDRGGDAGARDGTQFVQGDGAAPVDLGNHDLGPVLPLVPQFITIAAGSFAMGSPPNEPCRDDDETRHPVTLTYDFEMQPVEVTRQQFSGLMGYDPSMARCGNDPACPVNMVNWSEAAAYSNALSHQAGLPPCYQCSGVMRDVVCTVAPAFRAPPLSIVDCPGYRLPTEAEWEYAYRAGSTTALFNGPLPADSCNAPHSNADAIAWYLKNSGLNLHLGAQKQPNAWGLYDMAGNALEWTNDGWTADLGQAAATNPTGATSGDRATVRGGSCAKLPGDLRAARRRSQPKTARAITLSFRCARTLLP